MDDQLGRVLDDRYRLVAAIGAGASAHVFLADDTRLRRRVAVKLLHESLAADTMFLRRFEAEARLVAGLNHPHIMAVHDWGHQGVPYLVTEYLSGGSLRRMLDEGVRLTPSQTLVIGLEAARALDYAHRRGLVHRDIKPDNVIFDSEGRLRIADFGLARALAESSVTEPSGTFLGSARYASPEQAKGSTLDGRSDVYSLALVLGEAMSGRLPFDADTQLGTLMARTEADYDPGEAAGLLRRALIRAGARDPNERPDADGFAVAMMATAEQLPRPEPLPLAGAIERTPSNAEPADATEIGTGSVAVVAAETPEPGFDPVDDDLSRRDLKAIARKEKYRRRTDRLLAIEQGDVKRRRWPWAIVALVLAAAAVVGGFLLYDSSRTEPITAPSVVGLSIDDLDAVIGDLDLTVRRLDVRRDGTQVGEIVAQSPAPGVEMQTGDELEVTVSLGEPKALVPTDLVGMALDAAELRLQAELLVLGEVTRVFDEEAPIDQVLEILEPLPELERGSAVALLVSDGPAPRPVPEGLVGLSEADAITVIEAARLVATRVEEFSDDVELGLVIAVTPPPGTELAVGSPVEIVVSLGREPVIVPDVEGLGIDEAQTILEDAGLVVIEIEGPPGRPVLTTDPPSGTELFAGDEVVIFTVGAGNGNGN